MVVSLLVLVSALCCCWYVFFVRAVCDGVGVGVSVAGGGVGGVGVGVGIIGVGARVVLLCMLPTFCTTPTCLLYCCLLYTSPSPRD